MKICVHTLYVYLERGLGSLTLTELFKIREIGTIFFEVEIKQTCMHKLIGVFVDTMYNSMQFRKCIDVWEFGKFAQVRGLDTFDRL